MAEVGKVPRPHVGGTTRRAVVYGVYVKVANTGGRPISVAGVLIRHKEDGAITESPIKQGKTLGPGEVSKYLVKGFRVSRESVDDLGGIYVEDYIQGKWRLRRRRFKKLLKACLKSCGTKVNVVN